MATSSDTVYVALESGVARLPDGSEFNFARGLSRVHGSHPIIKQCPSMWEPVSETVTFGPDGSRYSAGE
jgi:hypothetical protein